MSAFLYRFFYRLTMISFVLLLAAVGSELVHRRQLAKGPQSPQPELGMTIPYDVGRQRVYISKEDHLRDHELEGYRLWAASAFIVFALVAGIYGYLRRFEP